MSDATPDDALVSAKPDGGSCGVDDCTKIVMDGLWHNNPLL